MDLRSIFLQYLLHYDNRIKHVWPYSHKHDKLDESVLFSNVNTLSQHNINVLRTSQDKSVNNYGNKLIDVCRNTGVYIANGRLGLDAGIGKLTCKDTSVIDYCIALQICS